MAATYAVPVQLRRQHSRDQDPRGKGPTDQGASDQSPSEDSGANDLGRGRASARVLIGPIVMTVGAIVALVGSFQRWLSSGSVGRTSYELLGLIHRLGFVPNGITRAIVRSWPLMPLLLTAGVVAVWWGWRLVGAAVSTLGALFAGAIGCFVAFATPDTRAIQVSNGPATTAVGASIVMLGSMLVVLVRVRSADANPR